MIVHNNNVKIYLTTLLVTSVRITSFVCRSKAGFAFMVAVLGKDHFDRRINEISCHDIHINIIMILIHTIMVSS